MIGRIPRWLSVVGIVMAASACDNVSWGGFTLRLEGPDADTTGTASDTTLTVSSGDVSASLGPVLYVGARSGNTAELVPVAEITDVGLQPIVSGDGAEAARRRILQQRLQAGGELVLFHQGARVGSLVVETVDTVSGTYCAPHLRASGHLLLVPEASDAERFLGLDPQAGNPFPFESYQDLSSVYDQRVASLNLGAEAVPLVGAEWPPSLLDIREDLQVLDLPGTEGPAVMATFLYQDRLQVGPAPEEAYSLMILGEPRGPRFDLTYTWYRPVATEGKGAPRYFSRMDWDRDGQDEILLEVLGSDSRWFAAIDRKTDGWETIYQDPCGAPGAQGGGG
jgi:hypothetical protein